MDMNLIIGSFFGIPLFVLGLFLCAGKFVSLIAGFHTSDQHQGYNSKKADRFVGFFLLLISVLVVFVKFKDMSISIASKLLIVVLCVILIILVLLSTCSNNSSGGSGGGGSYRSSGGSFGGFSTGGGHK